MFFKKHVHTISWRLGGLHLFFEVFVRTTFLTGLKHFADSTSRMDLPEEDSRSRSPKGFRRRWTAGEASSLQDAAPMQDDEVSGPLQMQSLPSDAKQFDSSNVDAILVTACFFSGFS